MPAAGGGRPEALPDARRRQRQRRLRRECATAWRHGQRSGEVLAMRASGADVAADGEGGVGSRLVQAPASRITLAAIGFLGRLFPACCLTPYLAASQ